MINYLQAMYKAISFTKSISPKHRNATREPGWKPRNRTPCSGGTTAPGAEAAPRQGQFSLSDTGSSRKEAKCLSSYIARQWSILWKHISLHISMRNYWERVANAILFPGPLSEIWSHLPPPTYLRQSLKSFIKKNKIQSPLQRLLLGYFFFIRSYKGTTITMVLPIKIIRIYLRKWKLENRRKAGSVTTVP